LFSQPVVPLLTHDSVADIPRACSSPRIRNGYLISRCFAALL
jgi:hypothetical protein